MPLLQAAQVLGKSVSQHQRRTRTARMIYPKKQPLNIFTLEGGQRVGEKGRKSKG